MIREASPKRTAVVQRAHEVDEGVCAQAVALLLKKSLPKEKGGPETASDDAEEFRKEAAAEDSSGEDVRQEDSRAR
jgi:hypothetical protein